MSEPFAATVIAPQYPPHQKHKVIFETFDRLNPGEAMLLVNDHDPVPLHSQFQLQRDGLFTWEYIQRGPHEFKIRIGRIN